MIVDIQEIVRALNERCAVGGGSLMKARSSKRIRTPLGVMAFESHTESRLVARDLLDGKKKIFEIGTSNRVSLWQAFPMQVLLIATLAAVGLVCASISVSFSFETVNTVERVTRAATVATAGGDSLLNDVNEAVLALADSWVFFTAGVMSIIAGACAVFRARIDSGIGLILSGASLIKARAIFESIGVVPQQHAAEVISNIAVQRVIFAPSLITAALFVAGVASVAAGCVVCLKHYCKYKRLFYVASGADERDSLLSRVQIFSLQEMSVD